MGELKKRQPLPLFQNPLKHGTFETAPQVNASQRGSLGLQ